MIIYAYMIMYISKRPSATCRRPLGFEGIKFDLIFVVLFDAVVSLTLYVMEVNSISTSSSFSISISLLVSVAVVVLAFVVVLVLLLA